MRSNRIIKYKKLTFIPIIIFLLIGCSKNQIEIIKGEKGIFNLCQWDFNKNGNVKLDGEWEFYWNQLLTYSDFKEKVNLSLVIAEVPMGWTEYSEDGKRILGQGFATYRLKVKTDLKAGTLMSFRINSLSSAYKLYINDKEIVSSGKVAASKEEYSPRYKPLTAVFNIPDSEFDIIIQVANYDFYKGGIWYSICMGTVEGIGKLQDTLVGKELFIVGVLLFISLFYFSNYFYGNGVKMHKYFACICALGILCFDFLGQMIICSIFPKIPFSFFIFIGYAATQWIAFFLILYVGELFPTRFNKYGNYVFGGLTGILTLLFLFTPTYFYTRFGHMGNYIMIFEVFYTVILAYIGFKNKRQGAILYFFATIITLFTVIHDVLFITNLVNSDFREMAFIGVFMLILCHTLIHLKINISEYNQKEQLIIEVENSKEECVINERKFLQAQIKPHFLYNALSVIAALSTRNPIETRRLIINLSEYLRSSFDFDSCDDLVPLYKELELVKAYVEIEKARFRHRLEFILNCEDTPKIRIPKLSIQPLVENSIRHGILKKVEGGKVILNIRKEDGKLKIEIIDNGDGMSQEIVEKLVQGSDSIKGVGLKNINRRLIHLYGKGLNIKSRLNDGTSISFTIPFIEVENEDEFTGG